MHVYVFVKCSVSALTFLGATVNERVCVRVSIQCLVQSFNPQIFLGFLFLFLVLFILLLHVVADCTTFYSTYLNRMSKNV